MAVLNFSIWCEASISINTTLNYAQENVHNNQKGSYITREFTVINQDKKNCFIKCLRQKSN